MDFSNRGGRPAPNEQSPFAPMGAQQGATKNKKSSKLGKATSALVVLAIAALLVLVAGAYLLSKNGKSDEASNLKTNQYQAVFLSGGQVYFGKIKEFTSSYITLEDIYYLRVNQQVQPNQSNQQNAQTDISLAKLGNELHGPEDMMFINRSEVQFWENLKDDGQVVKAITEYKKNPDAANQQQSNTSNNTNTTNTTNNNTNNNTNTTGNR